MNLANYETYRVLFFLGFFILMFTTESFFPARKWQDSRFKRLSFHGFMATINTLLHRLFAFLPLFLLSYWVAEKGWGLAPLLGISGWMEIIASLVVLDFFDYLWHRWNHEIPFLWRFHKVHHSDNHVDTTTSLRFHPGELLLSGIMKSIWIIVWGPSALAFAIFESGISMASQFHHSNIDFPDKIDKFLGYFIVTPRFHAGHHVVSGATRNNNYSTIFVLWDRLCGSWRKPVADEFGELGLAKGRQWDLDFWRTMKAPLGNEIR